MWRMLVQSMRMGVEPLIDGGGRGLVWLAGEFVISVSSIVPPMVMALAIGRIGDWNRAQLIFLVGFSMTGRGIAQLCGGENVMMISRKIARGQLDHNLIQPIPLWKSLVIEGFGSIDLLITIVLGLSCFTWGLMAEGRSDPIWWIAVVLNVVASATIVFATQYLWGSMAFYFPQAAEEITTITDSAISQLSILPINGALPIVKAVLSSILPIAMIGSIPSYILIHKTGATLFVVPIFATIYTLISLTIFNKGLQHYGKFSVSRYSSFGHRR